MVSSLQNKSVLDQCGYFTFENHAGDELTNITIPKDDEFVQMAAHMVLGMVCWVELVGNPFLVSDTLDGGKGGGRLWFVVVVVGCVCGWL